MIKKSALLFLCSFASAAWAQKNTYKGLPSLIWPKLYDIAFVKASDEPGAFERPVFSAEVKALNNKTILLPGYMVPVDNPLGASRIMLSSLPLNACFFCGIGGMETVVEVHLRRKTSWIEKPVEIKGILRLNDSDPDRMIYLLEEAELMGPLEF